MKMKDARQGRVGRVETVDDPGPSSRELRAPPPRICEEMNVRVCECVSQAVMVE